MAVSRSHPPTLETLARRLVRSASLIAPGDVVLAAVSGGPDSMALLHVLARLRRPLRFALVAHGVDHGLRPAAANELALAASLARRLDVPFATTRVDVSPGANLHQRARDARFAALRDAASRAHATSIATAHHADDRAETVLIRLLSGSGPLGLACLPPRAGDLIRPFLLARRSDVDAHLARHHIDAAHDPSNEDPRYLRSRVRAEVIPLLASLSPAIVDHLSSLATEMAELLDGSLRTDLRRPARELERASRRPPSPAGDGDHQVVCRSMATHPRVLTSKPEKAAPSGGADHEPGPRARHQGNHEEG